MKKILLLSAVLIGAATASQAGVHFSFGFPLPPLPHVAVSVPAPVYVDPAPVYAAPCPPTVYAPPVYVAPPVVSFGFGGCYPRYYGGSYYHGYHGGYYGGHYGGGYGHYGHRH